MGTGSVILPGDAQRMSAGTGVTHSEYNHSKTEPVHLLQIWILPEREGIEPGYEQKSFAEEEKRGRLRLIASPGTEDGAVKIHQDARLYVSLLDASQAVTHELGPGRHAWLQVARGSVELNGEFLTQGDGAAVSKETALKIAGLEPSEVLLFDLA
ncbi:MAG TPA: pirin family protein, partial [Pyrinomonadaceae bacterium]|jgi:hypothetical protein